MATERKRVLGELLAWELFHLPGLIWGDNPPDLKALDPYRTDGERQKPVKSEAQVERESTVAWGRLKDAWVGDAETVVMDTSGQVIHGR